MIDLQTLITAIKENNLDLFKNISKEDIQPHLDVLFDTKVCVAVDLSYSLISLAARCGRIEIVKELIRLGADVNKTSNDGDYPLLCAASLGYTEIVDVLLNHNANVNKTDNQNKTPLVQACFYRHTKIAQRLLEHNADVNIATKDGKTPLYWTAYYGYTETAQRLLEYNADVDNGGRNTELPLLRAAINYDTKTVQELVKAHITQNKIDTLLWLSKKFPMIRDAVEKYQDRFKITKLYLRMKELRRAPELAQTEADHRLIRIDKLPHTMQVEILSRTVDTVISNNLHELLFKHTNKLTSQTDGNGTTQTVSANNKRKRDGDDDPNPTPEKRTKQEASKPII